MMFVWFVLLSIGWGIYWYFYVRSWGQPSFQSLDTRQKIIVIVCIVVIIGASAGIGMGPGKRLLISIFSK